MSQTSEIPRIYPQSPELPEWEHKIDLVRRTVAAGATPDELELFFHQARRAGLDPLAKQIYFVKRQGKGVVQVGIDGLRLIADRTGKYAGSDDSIYGANNERGYPSAATVTVYKMVSGKRCPFTATARWDEYFPGDAQGFQWKRMPYAMLGKCAEALALRKAFPADMSGLYVHEEMEQAGETQEPSHARESSLYTQPETPKIDIKADATAYLSSVLVMSADDIASFQSEIGSKWPEAALIAKQKGIETVDGLLDMNRPASEDSGEGKTAFGYVPMRWPMPKMFNEPATESQSKMSRSKARERMLDLDELDIVRRLVLAAYGLEDDGSKATMSLFIDWLMNSDDETLDRASAAAEQEPRPEL